MCLPCSFNIVVDQDDIDNGSAGSTCFCPLARAVRRRYPDLREIEVFQSYLRAFEGIMAKPVTLFLDRSAILFILRFDYRLPVTTCKFSISSYDARGWADAADVIEKYRDECADERTRLDQM